MKLRHRFKKAARSTGPGGFTKALERHVAMYFPRGSTLVVSFDNMKSREAKPPVYPFGFGAIEAEGHSHLGIMMARRNDWFRQRDLDEFFTQLKEDRFFDQFSRVVFYGTSMGGYGALCFSAACPSADVFVFGPQTSLDQKVVPFETRYRPGFARGDWYDSPYADGAKSAELAAKVIVLGDPYVAKDRAHIERLPQHNLTWMKCPFFGHNPARHLRHMNVLGDICRAGWKGDLTEELFTKIRREGRKDGKSMVRFVLAQAIDKGHYALAGRALDSIAITRPGWNFPMIRRVIAQEKAKQKQNSTS